MPWGIKSYEKMIWLILRPPHLMSKQWDLATCQHSCLTTVASITATIVTNIVLQPSIPYKSGLIFKLTFYEF